MADLSGKVVLVTGASRGIGAAAATALAKAGARVMLTARAGARCADVAHAIAAAADLNGQEFSLGDETFRSRLNLGG